MKNWGRLPPLLTGLQTVGLTRRPPNEPLRITQPSQPMQHCLPHRVDKFIGGFDQVFGYPALSYEVHYGEEQEGFVRCAMASDLRIPVPAPVSPKLAEHLEVFVEHLPE